MWVGVCVGAGLSPEALVLSLKLGVGMCWQCCRTYIVGMWQFADSNGEWSKLHVTALDST